MKKIYLYGIAACMGVSLMACDGYKEPNPPAQTNPQLPVLQLSDVTITNELSTSPYDLTTLVNEQATIALAKVASTELGEGYHFGANAYISADGFETSFEVPVVSEKIDAQDVWQLYILPTTLSNVYHENISWNNDQNTIQLRYNITTVYDTGNTNQVAILGGSDNLYGPYDVTLTPLEAETHYYYLYTPGNSNGWNQEASQWLYSENENGPFWGYAILDGEFKFADTLDWSGINYGKSDEAGILSTDGDAPNLSVSEKGLYYCTVNVVDLNYSTTLVSTYGLIGSATPGGWDSATNMTSDDYLIWTVDAYLVPGEYKFRGTDDWAVNLGGDPNSLTQDGANIVFNGEEGEYTVTLNLKDIPYSCKVVKK